MTARYLHFIDQDGLHCHLVRNSEAQSLQNFDSSEQGVMAFAQWLNTARAGLHTFLVDVVDEGFHVESIPHVTGSDRRALISRKLTQHFFGSPYAAALSLGRDRTGRRDEKVLFTAITRPTLIEPWLAALRAAEAPLTAIYTIPLLTTRLVTRISPDITRGLILLLSKSGIRQIYFDQGKLRFSRLAPPPEGAIALWGRDCLREAQKTYQYLNAQRWLPRGTPLPVWIALSQRDTLSVLADLEPGATDNLVFRIAPLETLAMHIGAKLDITHSDSRSLLMQMALRESGGTQLAPPAERRYYRIWQARFAIVVTGFVVLVASGLLSLKWALEAQAEYQEATKQTSQAEQDGARYNKLLASLPRMPTSLDSLRGTVDGIDQLGARVVDPRMPLLHISHVMEQFPDITLDAFQWQEDGWTETAPPLPKAPLSPPGHSVELTASLPESAEINPRATIARVQAFADALRVGQKYDVVLLQQPFDTDSDKVLKSNQQNLGKRPVFRLRLKMQGTRP